tara:strand:+ start:697 stop:1035 length:339 start_codon:yes stop_codon:yes gene_type:complete
MYGIPKNEARYVMDIHGYTGKELIELKQFILESYYNAFLGNRVGDKEVIGEYLKKSCSAEGKTRNWQIYAFNDFYMERDGLVVFEERDDGSNDLIIDLSNWELEHMWKLNCN